MDEESALDSARSMLQSTISRTLKPIHTATSLATSKPARRAYISTILIFLTALVLLATAVIAYLTFYYSYIPTRSFSRPIHLQFDPPPTFPPSTHVYPHGIASLDRLLVAQQAYDVHVELRMPRTPNNLAAGNFMLELNLLAAPVESVASKIAQAVGGEELDDIVASSRRPALLEYRSWAMEVRERVVWAAWYALGWRREEETMRVEMLEGVVFERGWRNVPRQMRLELKSREVLQVYGCKVEFRAQLRGLRYLMYNHRIISFITFTSIFYAIELASLLTTYALSLFLFPHSSVFSEPSTKPEPDDASVKTELDVPIKAEDDYSDGSLSDTSRSFPTYSRQPPLHYTSRGIKRESDSAPLDPVAPGEAADDEDESERDDFVLGQDDTLRGVGIDSGLGTSMESEMGGRGKGVRRRRSGGI